MNGPFLSLVQVFDGDPAAAGFVREALIEIGGVRALVITYRFGRTQLLVHESEREKAFCLLEALYAFLTILRN